MAGHNVAAFVEGPFMQQTFDVRYLLAECVVRGARFLDTKCPGWEKQVNVCDLDMRDDRMCVLGQVYGEAFIAIHSFKKDWYWMLANGFIMHPDDFSVPRYAALTEQWRQAVKHRQLQEVA